VLVGVSFVDCLNSLARNAEFDRISRRQAARCTQARWHAACTHVLAKYKQPALDCVCVCRKHTQNSSFWSELTQGHSFLALPSLHVNMPHLALVKDATGNNVVIKAVLAEEASELEAEAAAYEALLPLQGKEVPTFLAKGKVAAAGGEELDAMKIWWACVVWLWFCNCQCNPTTEGWWGARGDGIVETRQWWGWRLSRASLRCHVPMIHWFVPCSAWFMLTTVTRLCCICGGAWDARYFVHQISCLGKIKSLEKVKASRSPCCLWQLLSRMTLNVRTATVIVNTHERAFFCWWLRDPVPLLAIRINEYLFGMWSVHAIFCVNMWKVHHTVTNSALLRTARLCIKCRCSYLTAHSKNQEHTT